MLKTFPLLPRLSLPLSTRGISMKKMSTKPQPICPKFISVEEANISSTNNTNGLRFRLVSYNILAQAYVKSSLFPHSPSPSLKWKHRSEAILAVLKNLGPDFLCLQELDQDDFYRGNMETNGYSSIYIQRSGQKRDGCGIFYKRNGAELLIEDRIEYNDLVESFPAEKTICGQEQNDTLDTLARENNDADADAKNGSSVKKSTSADHGDLNDPRVRLKRDCVGIMAAFRLKDVFDHVVVIANTHLYWDPELADVKLAQAKYLLSRLDKFKEQVSDKFECVPSVILSGDFNSVPGDKVYQYLTSGSSSASEVEYTESDESPIPLSSVYALTRGEPPFTNCTPDFTDTLDYIFFSPADFIKPVSILQLPSLNSPDVSGGLPNYYHPSDHLPIGAEFEITRE